MFLKCFIPRSIFKHGLGLFHNWQTCNLNVTFGDGGHVGCDGSVTPLEEMNSVYSMAHQQGNWFSNNNILMCFCVGHST